MRGRIIFDHGHRPAFRCVDGTFADPDPVDAFAFHVTARASGKLVGCARIVRFADAQTRFTQALLGAKRLDEILAGLGSSIPSSGESGRWIVDPEHRGRTLGRYLMSGVYATARWLGLRTVLGWSGTHDRQDRAFMSMGWMPMADFPTFPAPQFDDEVKLMYFDVTNMKPVQADLSFRMAELLSLDDPRAQALVPSVGSRTGEAWFLP
jgi:GNAT superfamily N-acetyltransferase